MKAKASVLRQWDILQWQKCLDKFLASRPYDPGYPAIRCENTQLTIARYYDGITYNGKHYTYFEPTIPDLPPNPDGSPYVAWLLVRDDFLNFATEEAKKMDAAEKKKTDATQGELGI